MAVTEAVENYLETIHILSLAKPEVHAVDICNHLNYSRPTVSIVLRQMKDQDLVTVDEHNHIRLTAKGREIAISIYERHVLLTQMFESLGVSKETAQEDACKVEHDLSPETFEAIKRYCLEGHSPKSEII